MPLSFLDELGVARRGVLVALEIAPFRLQAEALAIRLRVRVDDEAEDPREVLLPLEAIGRADLERLARSLALFSLQASFAAPGSSFDRGVRASFGDAKTVRIF